MNISPQSPATAHREPQKTRAERTCNIVTFYEDFAGAVRAHHAFDCLVRDFSGDRPVHATSWSFAMLGMSALSASVIRLASGADLIVVAAKGDTKLPPPIRSLIETCMKNGENGVPVLVALHDEELDPDGEAAPLCSALARIARERGATFVYGRDLEPRLKQTFPGASIHHGTESSIRVLPEVPQRTATTHRWWGIND